MPSQKNNRTPGVSLLSAGATASLAAMSLSSARSFVSPVLRQGPPAVVEQPLVQGTVPEAQVAAASSGAPLAVGAAGIAVAVGAARRSARRSQKSAVTAHATMTKTEIDTDCVNAIRFLAVDAVNKSNSGHP
eukprot:CAMPEP_0183420688 /NCGR_PEP_ID=MMETSP0370-20130417/26614_1 /TAXON_ID=268820 /ORGANISM="Peridinium aciculiferum, Strain PAER-2" /LENGTH=131 /DNA_ID=CAMNT_0025604591 /DNA_START=83 /DNA_END=474 /DNA_ORIENTATION=+